MSVICGIYYTDGRAVAPETGVAMMDKLGIYHSDISGTWNVGSVFLGCHAQYVTPESAGEVIPYHDALTGLTITADAIVDNRTELSDKLGIDHGKRQEIPDSLLILMAYQKWGQDCPRYLLGDFAFSIWDERQRELFCAVDHLGARAFYYYWSGKLFAFSTLIKPLFVLAEIEKKYNETWIADFLAIPAVMHQLDPEITLFQGVYILPAGHMLSIQPDAMKKRVYWQVERRPKLQLKSDAAYDEAFREVLVEAVHCRMRSVRPVGVMLSGGLDSTSVASMAARELALAGRRLRAFSAIPMANYQDWLPANRLADETPYIEAVREHAGNIDVTYCRSEGKHPLSDTTRLLTMLEHPYKIFVNLFWIDTIFAAASEQGIAVLLNGQNGNATISWGAIRPYALSLARAGQWQLLLREARALAERRGRNPLRTFLGLVKAVMPYPIQKVEYLVHNRDTNVRALSPINPSFARQMRVEKRFAQYKYDPYYLNILDSFEYRRMLLGLDTFSHMGPINTKLGLVHGVTLRDPTADCRVIEFCLSLPEAQYVRDGQERFLLRRAMTGILPDKVRLNETVRGRQSADWVQRLQPQWPQWPQIDAEIRAIGALTAEREYLDVDRIKRECENIDVDGNGLVDTHNLRMIIRSLIFSRFLRGEHK